MKFEKNFVICPNCKRRVWSYFLNREEIEIEGELYPVVSIAPVNFCPYCRYDFRHLHRRCEKCEFTDWADVFTDKCPYCEILKEGGE